MEKNFSQFLENLKLTPNQREDAKRSMKVLSTVLHDIFTIEVEMIVINTYLVLTKQKLRYVQLKMVLMLMCFSKLIIILMKNTWTMHQEYYRNVVTH